MTQNPPDLSYIHPQLRSLALPIANLIPDPKNARKHDRRNLDVIKASLTRFGMRAAIVAQRSGDDLIVRAGNGRMSVAKELDWTHLPVLVFEEADDEAVAYAIADNRTAELAEWNWENLTEALSTLDDADFDLDAVGFADVELQTLLQTTMDADFGFGDADTSATTPEGDDPRKEKATPEPVTFSVIVDFDNEHEQAELLTELEKRGLACRLMMF